MGGGEGSVGGVAGVGRLGITTYSRDQRSFTLILLSFPQKLINENGERVCEGKPTKRN